jgi:hypothetical protein
MENNLVTLSFDLRKQQWRGPCESLAVLCTVCTFKIYMLRPELLNADM